MSRPEAKRELHGLTLTQEASEKDQEGVTKIARLRTSPRRGGLRRGAPAVIRALQKCVEIGEGLFNKSLEVNFVVDLTVFCL